MTIGIPRANREKECAVGKTIKSLFVYFYILRMLIAKMKLFKVWTATEYTFPDACHAIWDLD